jgi:ubiquinone/menaquinone biosynthesis C-methylase UbiE
MKYSQNDIEKYYDNYGDRETGRLTSTPVDEVSLYIYSRFIDKYIPHGGRILEIGAGSGRFTEKLSTISTEVIVTDISKVQLNLNRKYAKERKYESNILMWSQVDITDLSEFSESEFDAVLAYGGPLSYALDKRFEAAYGINRILKKDGILLLSVMSILGTMHRNLGSILNISFESNEAILNTGDIDKSTIPKRDGHSMHLFRSKELGELLEKSNFKTLSMSASNFLSLGWEEKLDELKKSDNKWSQYLEWELNACMEIGALDAGTHIIAAAQKN